MLIKNYYLIKAAINKKRYLNLFSTLFSYLLKRDRVSGLPSVVEIEPTNRCDLKCSLCIKGMGMLRRPIGDMTFKRFKTIIDKLDKGIIYLVLYFFGEPLLNSEVYRMIKYAKDKKIFVRLSTNAVFEDKMHALELVNSGLDELIITLDCASSQTYQKYKKSDRFYEVVENVRLIVNERKSNKRPLIYLQFLIMRDNEHEISKFKDLSKDLRVDRALFKKIRVDHFGIEPRREFLPENKKYIRRVYLTPSQKKSCHRTWISTVIFWDGSVVPCCYDMDGNHIFGNVFLENFEDIWNGQRYNSFRREVLNDISKVALCKQCSVKGFFDCSFTSAPLNKECYDYSD